MLHFCLVKPLRAVLRCAILEERGNHSSQTEPLREWIVDMITETHTNTELPGDKYVVVKNHQLHVNESNLRGLFSKVRENEVTDGDLPGIADLFGRVKPFRDALVVFWLNTEVTLDDMVDFVAKVHDPEVEERMRRLTGMVDGELTTDPAVLESGFTLLDKLLMVAEDDRTISEVYATKAYMFWVIGEDDFALDNAVKSTSVNPEQTLGRLVAMALGLDIRFKDRKA